METKTKLSLVLLFFLSTPVFADALKALGDKEMLKLFPIVFEGHIQNVKSYKEDWEEFDGERVLRSTEFRALFRISEKIKKSPLADEIRLSFVVPGPSYGRYNKLFSHLNVGDFYRVYAEKILFEEEGEIVLVKLQSEGQIRKGTVEERLAESARRAELRSLPDSNSQAEALEKKSQKRISDKQVIVEPGADKSTDSDQYKLEKQDIPEAKEHLSCLPWIIAGVLLVVILLLLFKGKSTS